MVVPARDWCQRNGYTDSNGGSDYKAALTDPDMLASIASLGDLMAAENYPMLSLQQQLNDVANEEVYSLLLTSKGDGMIIEDDIDRLSRVGNADIMIELSIERVSRGPNKSVQFRITSVDTSSGKIVHGDVGSSSASSAPVGLLVKQSMKNIMPNFYSRIDAHFAAISEKGREGSIVFMIADDCPLDMSQTVTRNGESGELSEFLDYWLDENCVDGVHSTQGKSRVRMAFNQVRIPLFGKARAGGFGASSERVKALDAASFVKGLEADLDEMGISMSVTPIGLGKAIVTLGSAE